MYERDTRLSTNQLNLRQGVYISKQQSTQICTQPVKLLVFLIHFSLPGVHSFRQLMAGQLHNTIPHPHCNLPVKLSVQRPVFVDSSLSPPPQPSSSSSLQRRVPYPTLCRLLALHYIHICTVHSNFCCGGMISGKMTCTYHYPSATSASASARKPNYLCIRQQTTHQRHTQTLVHSELVEMIELEVVLSDLSPSLGLLLVLRGVWLALETHSDVCHDSFAELQANNSSPSEQQHTHTQTINYTHSYCWGENIKCWVPGTNRFRVHGKINNQAHEVVCNNATAISEANN